MKKIVKNLFVMFFVFFMLGNLVQAQNLFVNEFLASNDSCYADEYGEFDDWIEIYNPGPSPVDIGGMYITDDLTNPTAWQIPTTAPDTTTIPAGGFLVLWADKQPEQGVLHVKLKLSSGGEQIGLFASDGTTVIDTLTFGAQTTDVSEGRYPDASGNWLNFDNPTPGNTNKTIPVVVNEFMASNDSYSPDPFGEFDDWIEVYNVGTAPVDIGGMYITDDLTNPTAWQIPTTAPDTTTIQPGGFLVLWADKQPEQGVLHVKLKLSGGGEQVGLFASDGTTPIDTLTFSAQQSDTSYGRIQDGGTAWGFFSTPTIGTSNSSGVLLGIKDRVGILSKGFSLAQNYPNPFNPQTTIAYSLPKAAAVTFRIYNLLGKEVFHVDLPQQSSGYHKLTWNGSRLASGIYFYKMEAQEPGTGNTVFSELKKMILLK